MGTWQDAGETAIARATDMTPEQKAFLRGLPRHVPSAVIVDYDSEEVGCSMATFALSIHPMMVEVHPLELFDECVAILRGRLVEKVSKC